MIARDYLRGLRSQADVAAELGLSVRQVQRIEEIALARLVVGVCRAIRAEIGDLAPDEKPCRISPNRPEHGVHAPRARSVRNSWRADSRAGHPLQELLPMTTEATDLSSAIADLFRPAASQPAPADAIAQHAALMARLGASAIADASTMHAQALEHNPHLSAQFRTAECARDVAEIASMHTRAPIEDCLRQYARRIASTLGPDAPAARRVLDALDAEQRELDAAAARAEQDRAAAAAAEEARRAEVRAKREERKDRIAEAAQAEQTARAGYEAAVRTHQRIRAEALRERVAESGLSEVRDHLGRLWSVKDLILVGGDGTAELPPHYEMGVLERALDKYEAS